jgi:hypothetical protein
MKWNETGFLAIAVRNLQFMKNLAVIRRNLKLDLRFQAYHDRSSDFFG